MTITAFIHQVHVLVLVSASLLILSFNNSLGQQNEIDLTLTSPNGHEILTPGTDFIIRWTDTATRPGRYKLEFSLDNSSSWRTIAELVSMKSYKWRVPYLLSDSCIIRVTAYQDSSFFLTVTPDNYLGLQSIQFDKEGDLIVISGGRNNVNIWDARTGGIYADVTNHGYVPVVQFNSNDSLLGFVDSDSMIVLYDVPNKTEVLRHVVPNSHYTTFSFTKNPNQLVVSGQVSGNQVVQIFDRNNDTTVTIIDEFRVIDANPEKGILLLHNEDEREEKIGIYTLSNQSYTGLQYNVSSRILKGVLSPDGTYVGIGLRDGSSLIFDAVTGQLIHTLESDRNLLHLEFSRDNRRFLTVSNLTNTVGIWDVVTGEVITRLIEKTPFVRGAHFNPDDSTITTFAGNNGYGSSARILHWKTGEQLHEYRHNSNFMKDGIVSPDGTRIITVDAIIARIWPFDISKNFVDVSDSLWRIGYVVSTPLEKAIENGVVLQPNVISDHTMLVCKQDCFTSETIDIDVVTLNGQKLDVVVEPTWLEPGKIRVNMRTIPTGFYFLSYRDLHGSYVIPFVKR